MKTKVRTIREHVAGLNEAGREDIARAGHEYSIDFKEALVRERLGLVCRIPG